MSGISTAHLEGVKLAQMTLKSVLAKEAWDVMQAVALKVAGVGLGKFTSLPLAGALLDGFGSVLISCSLGMTVMAVLEKVMTDDCLGEQCAIAVQVFKYALPIITSLGTCYLLFGVNFKIMTVLFLYQFMNSHYHRAVLANPN